MKINISDINEAPQKIEFGLGMLVAKDPRDFPMSAALKTLGVADIPLPQYKYWNDSGWWGNQGSTPRCVGYALAHYMEDGPITHKNRTEPQPFVSPDDIYNWANANDEWAADGPHDGTSGRAGARFLLKNGYIDSFHLTQDIEELIRALLTVGPIPVGTVWFNSMFNTNAIGELIVSKNVNDVAGGHEYELNGYSQNTEQFRLKQSWGRGWGNKGHAYINKKDMAYLLEQNGDALLMIENKKKKEVA